MRLQVEEDGQGRPIPGALGLLGLLGIPESEFGAKWSSIWSSISCCSAISNLPIWYVVTPGGIRPRPGSCWLQVEVQVRVPDG